MAGLYIHIPFCSQKCSYCDFHFSTTFSGYRQRMIDAITAELKDRSGFLKGEMLQTIYFGGGTPSILNFSELQQLFSTIHSHFKVDASAEVTLEANPEDIDEERLDIWKTMGINRLSIGLQSFKSSDLEWMNRAHSKEQSIESVALAIKHGFTNLTVDLIYGLPDLANQEWVDHIRKVIELGVPHVSAYCLTIEPKTALSSWVTKGIINPQNEDQQADQFSLLVDELKRNGIEQYEISNFSKPGYESRHNSSYWQGKPYLGVGPSAHSFDGENRYWNVANNTQYMKAVESGETYSEMEKLSVQNRFNEKILVGLRTRSGVSITDLEAICDVPEEFRRTLKEFDVEGWLTISNGQIQLTNEGKLRADYIASELFLG